MEPQQPSTTASNASTDTTTPTTPVTPTTPTASATDNTLIFNILAYLGPLVLIPFVVARDQAQVQFHLKQGIVLFGIELIIYVAGGFLVALTFGLLAPVLMLLNLGCLVLTIVGIYHVVQKQEKPLPFIGFLADKVPL